MECIAKLKMSPTTVCQGGWSGFQGCSTMTCFLHAKNKKNMRHNLSLDALCYWFDWLTFKSDSSETSLDRFLRFALSLVQRLRQLWEACVKQHTHKICSLRSATKKETKAGNLRAIRTHRSAISRFLLRGCHFLPLHRSHFLGPPGGKPREGDWGRRRGEFDFVSSFSRSLSLCCRCRFASSSEC